MVGLALVEVRGLPNKKRLTIVDMMLVNSRIHLLWIYDARHALRSIQQEPCIIKIAKKRTWAIECSNGKRHLLGSSAFYTAPAATAKRLAVIIKLINSAYVHNQLPALHALARKMVVHEHQS